MAGKGGEASFGVMETLSNSDGCVTTDPTKLMRAGWTRPYVHYTSRKWSYERKSRPAGAAAVRWAEFQE